MHSGGLSGRVSFQWGYPAYPLSVAPGVRVTASSPSGPGASGPCPPPLTPTVAVRPSRTGLATKLCWPGSSEHRRLGMARNMAHVHDKCGHCTAEAVWLTRTIIYTTLGTCLNLSCMARGLLTQPAHQCVINL